MDPVSPLLLPMTAQVDGRGRLSIGGVDVLDLVAEVGTPVFVYDEEHLRSACRAALAAFPGGAAYASKAFLCTAMAALAHEEGMAIDVASGGELYVALHAGVPACRLVFHGSNKSTDELSTALQVGVGRIVIDSVDELARLERLMAGRPGCRQDVLLRINPAIDPHTHPSIATGQEDSKFGISLSSGDVAAAVARLSGPGSPLRLVGLHVHIGSQITHPAVLSEVAARLAPCFAGSRLEELCLGGGIPVAYAAGDEPGPSFAEWARHLAGVCRQAGIPERVRLSVEPGRSIVAGAAITCYTVGSIKAVPLHSGTGHSGTGHSGAGSHPAGSVRTYLSVDGGMSDNPRPALYGSRYEAFLLRDVTGRRPRAVTVVGKHCESGDVLVEEGHVPADTASGDVLATPVTGAYGYAMASNYNKLPRPAVVFVRDGRSRVVVRRETYEDLVRLDT